MLAGGFGKLYQYPQRPAHWNDPDLTDDRIHYIANAAGLGAQMVLLSDQSRIEAEKIARETKHLSLAGYPGFQKMYLGAMGFPMVIKE